VTHPDGSADTTGYDLNGNVTSQGVLDTTGATIRTTNYSYDPLNQLQSQTDPSSKTGWASSDVIGSSEVLGASPPFADRGETRAPQASGRELGSCP
jgi:YD repeat-containing protein